MQERISNSNSNIQLPADIKTMFREQDGEKGSK